MAAIQINMMVIAGTTIHIFYDNYFLLVATIARNALVTVYLHIQSFGKHDDAFH